MKQETLLYDPQEKGFCVLNATAARIWERLERPASAAELVDDIRVHFDIAQGADVQQDVAQALEELQGLRIVRESAGD